MPAPTLNVEPIASNDRTFRSPTNACRTAFSLVELLVVVAIIVLLLALLVPSLRQAKDYSKRAACAADLRGLGNATHAFISDNDGTTPSAVGNLLSILTSSNTSSSAYIYKMTRCPTTILDPFYGAPVGLPYEMNVFKASASTAGKFSNITTPASSVLMGDEGYYYAATGRMNNSASGAFLTTSNAISSGTPDFDGLHGGFGNILWYDGHVTGELPFIPTQLPGTASAALTQMSVYHYGYFTPVPIGTTYANFTNTALYPNVVLNDNFLFVR